LYGYTTELMVRFDSHLGQLAAILSGGLERREEVLFIGLNVERHPTGSITGYPEALLTLKLFRNRVVSGGDLPWAKRDNPRLR